MWLFVFFDLPTQTKKQRKQYTLFRKKLKGDGFRMMQYSVYIRHCASGESADVHERRIKRIIPPSGQISVLRITDKQYSNIINFWSGAKESLPPSPQQLELF